MVRRAERAGEEGAGEAPPVRLEAEVFDPSGVTPGQVVAQAGAVAGMGSAALVALGWLSTSWLLMLCAVSFGLGLSAFLQRRTRWRRATLVVAPGQVEVQTGQWLGRTLRARRVRGLSTALQGRDVVVAVAMKTLRGTLDPLVIRLRESAEADTLCEALAVGRRGAGDLQWRMMDRRERSVMGLLAMGLSALVPLLHAFRLGAMTPLLVMGLLALVVMLMRETVAPGAEARIKLSALGVDLSAMSCGWGLIPYGCIEEVRRTSDRLELVLTDPHPTVVLSVPRQGPADEEQIAQLVAQIQSASLRARGLGPTERDGAEGLDELARGEESVAQWVQRLDTQAGSLGGGAYRGEGFRAADLWRALDDHDAAMDVRVGAARVLLRVAPERARVRVAQLASEQRDDGARRALESMLVEDEIDALAEQLERSGLWARPQARAGTGAEGAEGSSNAPPGKRIRGERA